MKKILVLTIAVIMILSFAGCGQKTVEVEEEQNQAKQEVEEEIVTVIEGEGFKYNIPNKLLQVYDMQSYSLDENGFSTAPWGEYLSEVEHIVVNDNVTWIGEYAFANSYNLKSVKVKSYDLEHIGDKAFYMCGDIENQSELEFVFESSPGFGEDVFGETWNNPNAYVRVNEENMHHWGRYLFYNPMYVYDYTFEPESVDEIIDLTMNRARYISFEDSDGAYKHNGGQLAKGNVKREFVDDKMMLVSGRKPAKITLGTRLRNFSPEHVKQQAIILKFQPETATDISFEFKDEIDIAFTFEGDEIYFNNFDNDIREPFFVPNYFEFKSDSAYQFFFAFDDKAIMRVLVWEDGNFSNNAIYETSLYNGDEEIYDSNWKMVINFGAEQQFSTYEYTVLDFENLIFPDKVEDVSETEQESEAGQQEIVNPMEIVSIILNDEFEPKSVCDCAPDMHMDFRQIPVIAEMSENGEYFMFGSDDHAPYIIRNEKLLYNDSDKGNQAIMFRFCPNDTQGLGFNLVNDNEVSMQFEDNKPYHVNMKKGRKTAYSEYENTNFELQSDKWYWAIMAVDTDGKYRSFIWQEDNTSNYALYEDDLDVTSGAWSWSIMFGANQTLYIHDYKIFDFLEFKALNLDELP